MKKKMLLVPFALLLVMSLIATGCVVPAPATEVEVDTPLLAQEHWGPEWLKEVPPILVQGRGDLVFEITPEDIARFHGCFGGGIGFGFRAVQEAMRVLFGEEAVQRHDLVVITRSMGCITSPVIHITGARFGPAVRRNNGRLIYDPTIEPNLIFIRRSTEEAVEVTIDSGVIIPERLRELAGARRERELTTSEQEEFDLLFDQYLRDIYLGQQEGLIVVSPVMDFEIPAMPALEEWSKPEGN